MKPDSLFALTFVSAPYVVHVFLMLQLGGGYLFGLPVGFVADSVGATIGATAAFILGRTVSIISWQNQHIIQISNLFNLNNILGCGSM